nr:harbinger transposase-derived nuclease domain-containing protein [Tanacetum cinerariifolium]
MLHRQQVREEFLHDLSTSSKCRDLIRISKNAFKILCQKLESGGGLRPTQRMIIEEQVASDDALRYHGHKGYPTINVLAACTFDLKFTYILSGGEGTTLDLRRIKNALTREDNLRIPNAHELLNALQDEEPRALRGIDDGGEEIRNSIEKPKAAKLRTKPICHYNEMLGLFAKDRPQEKPKAAKLRTKQIRHYNEMLELFAKDRATGEGVVTAKERNNIIKQNEQTTKTIDELVDPTSTDQIP